MVKKLAALALVAATVLPLPGCSKTPPGLSGTGAYKIKESVWATYGWSRGRMVYVIIFQPNSAVGFNPDGVAATLKAGDAKTGDSFEGGLDGNLEQSKSPFKINSRTYEASIENKPYRIANGAVFLVHVGSPTKVQQLQAQLAGAPKDEPDVPAFMESQVRKLVKETPKISEFPKEPAPEKPDKTKKK